MLAVPPEHGITGRDAYDAIKLKITQECFITAFTMSIAFKLWLFRV